MNGVPHIQYLEQMSSNMRTSRIFTQELGENIQYSETDQLKKEQKDCERMIQETQNSLKEETETQHIRYLQNFIWLLMREKKRIDKKLQKLM